MMRLKPLRVIRMDDWSPMVISSLERVLKIGSAGDSPAPVGDPPTGTAESNLGESASLLARTVAPIPSGESPDGTGGSPVLPKTIFQIRSKSIYSFLRAPRLL